MSSELNMRRRICAMRGFNDIREKDGDLWYGVLPVPRYERQMEAAATLLEQMETWAAKNDDILIITLRTEEEPAGQDNRRAIILHFATRSIVPVRVRESDFPDFEQRFAFAIATLWIAWKETIG